MSFDHHGQRVIRGNLGKVAQRRNRVEDRREKIKSIRDNSVEFMKNTYDTMSGAYTTISNSVRNYSMPIAGRIAIAASIGISLLVDGSLIWYDHQSRTHLTENEFDNEMKWEKVENRFYGLSGLYDKSNVPKSEHNWKIYRDIVSKRNSDLSADSLVIPTYLPQNTIENIARDSREKRMSIWP